MLRRLSFLPYLRTCPHSGETLPAFAQKAMSKKEIAEKEKAFKNLQHPWKGKKVAYFGDSITDPNIKASKVKYWGFLQDWQGVAIGDNKNTSYCHPFLSVYQLLTICVTDVTIK